jgi:hypothetical protein
VWPAQDDMLVFVVLALAVAILAVRGVTGRRNSSKSPQRVP